MELSDDSCRLGVNELSQCLDGRAKDCEAEKSRDANGNSLCAPLPPQAPRPDRLSQLIQLDALPADLSPSPGDGRVRG
jgi:hypothetical protein